MKALSKALLQSGAESFAAAGDIRAPQYDRERLTPGIVHVGVGNFHRAHQAVYLDQLFGLGRDHDWGIVGAGVRAADGRMRDALAAQDWLYTVVEQSAERSTARIVGAMIDFVDPSGMDGLVARMAAPETRIVSLTITEGGYYMDGDGAFDAAHPDIAAEAATPERPSTVFGAIVAALEARRAAGLPGFTVLSCDNLPGNGEVAKAAVLGVARLIKPDAAAWIEDNIAFPNGMVDRIAPAVRDRERAALARDFGLEDAAPVFCEEFTQWVLEDHFTAGRPALEAVGVEFTQDVEPYELMKLRVLNGGHAAMAYPAALLDIEFGYQAMATPLISDYLEKLTLTEILPVVTPPPGGDALAYFRKVQERFANPKIEDTIARLAQDGSNRQPKFIFPTIVDGLRRGQSIEGLALVCALWRRLLEGRTESGAEAPFDDPRGEALRQAALSSRENPVAFLEQRDIYGELSDVEPFRAAFVSAAGAISQLGVEQALRGYLSDAA